MSDYNLATVIDGEYKGEIVAPYCKLRFGYLCELDSTHTKTTAYIDHEHLRFWRNINSITVKDGKVVNVEYSDNE